MAKPRISGWCELEFTAASSSWSWEGISPGIEADEELDNNDEVSSAALSWTSDASQALPGSFASPAWEEIFSSTAVGCVPDSSAKGMEWRFLSPEIERVNRVDWGCRWSLSGNAWYDWGCGITRRKKNPTKHMVNVPTARSRRKWPVSSSKANEDTVAKKKALSPKAARGKAVALPRWLGQFKAAMDKWITKSHDGEWEGSDMFWQPRQKRHIRRYR